MGNAHAGAPSSDVKTNIALKKEGLIFYEKLEENIERLHFKCRNDFPTEKVQRSSLESCTKHDTSELPFSQSYEFK